jgi:hypothetical protein
VTHIQIANPRERRRFRLVVAAILLGTARGPEVGRELSLYQLLAYVLLIMSGALSLRVFTSMLRAE